MYFGKKKIKSKCKVILFNVVSVHVCSIFLNETKFVSVFPIDKRSDNKNKYSNYRPVSVFNCFSKIHEIVFKMKLALERQFLHNMY